MRIAIHQPNFFPWLGYFVKIVRSDKFIFLDDVQFPKTGGSYVNRSEILVQGKRQWLAAEIKRPHGTWNINESFFSNPNWSKKVVNTLQCNYSKAPYFKNHKDFIFSLVLKDVENLAELNINAIVEISKELRIDTSFYKSSELSINTLSTQRLVDIIKHFEGTIYLSGSGGDKYQEAELYKQNGIELQYNTFNHPVYKQLNTDSFEKGLSIIDAIFNIGIDELSKTLHNE
jgi:hypothetical protein